jgi:hypothetical protein
MAAGAGGQTIKRRRDKGKLPHRQSGGRWLPWRCGFTLEYCRALSTGVRLRVVRLAYKAAPERNFLRGEEISMTCLSTLDTTKYGLSRAIALVHAPAGRAGAGGVSRIDRHAGDAGGSALVLEKEAQLVERPARMLGAVGLRNRDLFADTRQVFDGDSASGAFGDRDETLAGAVVNVGGAAMLLAPSSVKQPARAARAELLQATADAAEPLPHPFELATRVERAVAVGGNVLDAKIHAEKAFGLGRGRGRCLNCDGEVPAVVAEQQVGLPESAGLKLGSLFAAVGETEAKAAVDSGQFGGGDPMQLEAASIVDDRSPRPEEVLHRAIRLVAVADLGDGADGQLSGQAELSPQRVIGEPVEVKGPEGLRLPGNLGKPIADDVEAGHGRGKSSGGLVIHTQFASHGLHQHTVLFHKRGATSSPLLKQGVSGCDAQGDLFR